MMGSTLLQGLPSVAFGYMLVVARAGSAMLTGPALGENDIPATVRVVLAVLFAVLIYPSLPVTLPATPPAIVDLLGLLVPEIVIGAWIGFMARTLVMALAVAGNVASFMVGLSSVLQLDPALGVQVPALQRFFSLGAITLLFASGLYILPIQAIVGSYDVLPPGHVFDTAGAADLVTRAVGESFGLAARLAAPFVVMCIVWQVTMGFFSRLVPHIQVHVVSAPAQILGGLALLGTVVHIMFGAWSADMLRTLSSLPGS